MLSVRQSTAHAARSRIKGGRLRVVMLSGLARLMIWNGQDSVRGCLA